jgi:pimeloyl-ACP methyl ester carboxylesterase
MRSRLIILFVIGSLGLCSFIAPVGAAADAAKTCRLVDVPVSLAAGDPDDQFVQGQLCALGDPRGLPVQVLVHGYTLTRLYWDLPYGGGRYSYVDSAIASGYATFAIDRIGVGGSSKPPALAVTLDSNVWTLHEVVTAVRSGQVTGAPVTNVVLVGHSFGSAISVTEAGRFQDVDAVVATSFLHTVGAGIAPLLVSTEPAQLDPAFARSDLPLGYVTTVPGARQQFYAPDDTDPEVVAIDEQSKGTGTLGELGTFAEYLLPLSDALRVKVPVLLAIGQDDLYFCSLGLPCPDAASVVARERPYFGPQAQLSGYVLPGAGHNMSLELNSGAATAAILTWIGTHRLHT